MTQRMWKQAMDVVRHSRLLWVLPLAALSAFSFSFAATGEITLTPFSTNFLNPIGIDFHEDQTAANGIGNLIHSVNYDGGEPNNLDLVAVPSGDHFQFSTLHGLTQELKIATVRSSPGCQQFPVGDVFTGTGKPGEIVRIATNHSIYGPAQNNPGALLAGNAPNTSWVQLPGEPDLLRGSLFVDRSCAFGGDLIVATGNDGPTGGGDVWRVKVNGQAQLLTTITDPQTGVDVHLEGLLTLPVNAAYGPWSGTILVGDENFNTALNRGGRIWSITPGGSVTPYSLEFNGAGGVHFPVKPEDLDLIEAGQNFFGVNYANSRLLTASSTDLAPFVGDILVTQEYPCGSRSPSISIPCDGSQTATSGLYAVRYVGRGGNAFGGMFNVTPFTFSATSVMNIDQWEHVTLAPLGNPHLKIVKTPDNATFNIGNPLSFTIVVTSNGTGAAHDVTLADPMPTTGGLTWAVASVTPNLPCSINGSQTLSCSFGDMNPGTSVTVVVTSNNVGGAPAASCTGQKLNNLATAGAADVAPPVTDSGDYICQPGSVTITKTPKGGTYNLGDNVSFGILVTSTGPGIAKNVVLNDPLPTLGNLNTWVISSDPSGVCTIASNTLTCSYGNLANGQTRSVTVATNAVGGANAPACPGGVSLNNIATVTADALPTKSDTGDYKCTPPSCSMSIVSKAVSGKELQVTIMNGSASVDSILTGLSLTWPTANGKLVQVKLDGDVVYDTPDIAAPSANLTSAQLVADTKKRKVDHGTSDVLHLVFEKNADTNLGNYSGTFTFDNTCPLSLVPANYCSLGYPFTSANPKTSIIFNENEVLQGFDPAVAAAGDTIRLYASDEHAPLLGVRTATFPVSAMSGNPSHVVNPLVGDKTIADPSGRPIFPSIYITDITGISDNASHTSAAYRAGDWQFGGTPVAPNDIFGTWKGAAKSGTSLITDADPAAKNGWSLGAGSDTPSGGFASVTNLGYGTEVRWNVNNLTVGGQPLQAGHTYRIQLIVHDGDQNKTGGDVGQACMLVNIQ